MDTGQNQNIHWMSSTTQSHTPRTTVGNARTPYPVIFPPVIHNVSPKDTPRSLGPATDIRHWTESEIEGELRALKKVILKKCKDWRFTGVIHVGNPEDDMLRRFDTLNQAWDELTQSRLTEDMLLATDILDILFAFVKTQWRNKKLKAWPDSLTVKDKEHLEHCGSEKADDSTAQKTSNVVSDLHFQSGNVSGEGRAMEATEDEEEPVATTAAIRAAKQSLTEQHDQAMKTALKLQAAKLEKVHQAALERAMEATKSHNVGHLPMLKSQPSQGIKADPMISDVDQSLKDAKSEEVAAKQRWVAQQETKKLRSQLKATAKQSRKEARRHSIALRIKTIELELGKAGKGTSVHHNQTAVVAAKNSQLEAHGSLIGVLRCDEEVEGVAELDHELAKSPIEAPTLQNESRMNTKLELAQENQRVRDQLKGNVDLQRSLEAAIADTGILRDRLTELELERENTKLATLKEIKDADAERCGLRATVTGLKRDLAKAQTREEEAVKHATAKSKELEEHVIKLKENLEVANSGRKADADVARMRIQELEESKALMRSAWEQLSTDKASVCTADATPHLEPGQDSEGFEAARGKLGAASQQSELQSDELRKKVNELERELKQAQEAEKQRIKDSSELSATIEELRKEMMASQTHENPSEDANKQDQDTMTMLHKQVEGSKETIEILEGEKSALVADKASLEQKVQDLELANAVFEGSAMLDIQDEPNSAAQEELDKLRREHSALINQCDGQVREIQKLTEKSQMLPTEQVPHDQIALLVKEKEDLLFGIQQRETSHDQDLRNLRADLEANYERSLRIQQEKFDTAINNNENFNRFKRELHDHVMREYHGKVEELKKYHVAELERAKEHLVAKERAELKKWAQQDQEKRHRREIDEQANLLQTERNSMRIAYQNSQDLVRNLRDVVNQLSEENRKLQQQDEGLHEGTRWLSEHNDELAERQRLKAQEADEQRQRAQRIEDEASFMAQDLEQRIGIEKGIATGQTESLKSAIKAYSEKIAALENQNTILAEALANSKRDGSPTIESEGPMQNLERKGKRSLDQEEVGEVHRQKTQKTEYSRENILPQAELIAPLPASASAVQSIQVPTAPFTSGSEKPALKPMEPQTTSEHGTQSKISQELSRLPNGRAGLSPQPQAPANRWIGMTAPQVRNELNSFRRTVLDYKLRWSKENGETIPLSKNRSLVRSFEDRIDELTVAWEEIQSTHSLTMASLKSIGLLDAISIMRNHPWHNKTSPPIMDKLDRLVARIYSETKKDNRDEAMMQP
ncbi:MAG: hypothetical protein M1835_000795 [Candelina submexicana]|nr:MAG: hypothetical protein M1835_000795 [Candelina submexicana]